VKTDLVDKLMRALVAVDPPRWEDAAHASEGLQCPDSLRRRLSEGIERRASLDELWPALDELAGAVGRSETAFSTDSPVEEASPVDWSPPPIGEDMIREFFTEVDGFLADLGPLLVDASADEPGILDEIYRRLHTIKGNSGMVGLTPLMRVVHAMEDLVKRIQTGKAPLDDPARAVLLEGIEVATSVTAAARDGSGEPVAWEAYRARVAALSGRGGAERPPPSSGEVPGGRRGDGPVQSAKTADATRTLRVDFARLDSLVNLVGEQVTTENRLARLIQQFRGRLDDLRPGRDCDDERAGVFPALTLEDGSTWSIEDFYEALEQAAAELELTSGKLQSSVLGMRMVPVSRLFNRHKATVFQVANALQKKAALVIEGGDAELDKRLVEQLEDPLLHLVRNAVSHGVDAPESRLRQGKTDEGTVTLRAYPEGNHMVIEVVDDGVGIDREVLRRKAVEKGFLRREEAAALDARETMELIFAPGFSTTGEVDDISGRGVGLDVVQERIARLGGAVTVDSRPGEGTTFRLTVPLTLALTRVLIVEAGGSPLAVPVATVRQVHNLEEVGVIEVGGRTMASVGEKTLPFVDLGPFLGFTGEQSPPRCSVVLLRVVHGDRVALFQVDRVLTQQQVVVKDMGALLARVPHCMGATINDDRCVLILDSASVIREWGRGSEWLLRGQAPAGPETALRPDSPAASTPTLRAAHVIVFSSRDVPTGLESTTLFQLTRLAPDTSVPKDAAAIIVSLDSADSLAPLTAVRAAAGPTVPVVALVSGEEPPSTVAVFEAGADDAWSDAHPPMERIQRLERLLAVYRHVVPSADQEDEA